MKKEIADYITRFEPEIQVRLHRLRELFFEVLPGTEECIRYKMPAYKVGSHYLYFAAYKGHIGFYPLYRLTDMEDELAEYRAQKTKNTLHFPHQKPLPVELIKKIVQRKSVQ